MVQAREGFLHHRTQEATADQKSPQLRKSYGANLDLPFLVEQLKCTGIMLSFS